MEIKPFVKPDWVPKPNGNAKNIDVRVILQDRRILIAQLKFRQQAAFDAHSSAWDCHVICLQGSGYVKVGDETAEIRAGETVFWPKHVEHQLWTEDSTMVTEMIEHVHQMAAPAQT